MEEWKDGRMEGWKNGRMEEWKDGEAPAASLPEGVLNPINCVLNQQQNERSEAERGGSGGFAAGGGAEPH